MKSLSLKLYLLLLFTFVSILSIQAQNAWINEFHYDNAAADVGEFVEVVIEDVGTYDLSSFTVLLYNGGDGKTYGSAHTLDSFTEGATEGNFTFYHKDITGIQNGAPDGFSLDYEGVLLQFISYEGSFAAVEGPADGVVSEDVGVEETGSTLIGESLQLTGTGSAYSDFTWLAPAAETKGQLNHGQILGSACSAPSSQAVFSTPSTLDVENNQISLNWNRGNGDNVLIIAKESETVDGFPQNGSSYTADANFSSGSELGTGNFVVYDGVATSVTVVGLTKGTAYHFAIFEYSSTDYCYLTTSETIIVTTTISVDNDSEVVEPSTQIAPSTVSSVANTEVDAHEVFRFDISDKGSDDGVPTLLQKIVIEKSTENTVVDWSSVIKGAKLNDGVTDLILTDLSLTKDSIVFDLTANEFVIPDGSTESIMLSIWLEENQDDQQILGFQIPAAHALVTDVSGSSFGLPNANAIVSNEHVINVLATQLIATHSWSEVYVNEPFDFAVSVQDANGNIDKLGRSLTVSSHGSGALSGLLQSDLIDGVGNFSNLSYDKPEEVTLSISDGTLTDEITITFIKPLISLDTSGFVSEFGRVTYPEKSDVSSYKISAQHLKDSVFVIAPEAFKLSLDSDFTYESDTLIFDSNNFIPSEIFVKFSPLANNGEIYEGTILHISTDADTVYLAVSGQEQSLDLSTIESVRDSMLGERVKIHAVVIGGENHFAERRIIQDKTAGISILGLNSADFVFGDSIEVQGLLTESDGWLTIIPEKEINNLSPDSIVVEPFVSTIADIETSKLLQRVTISNLQFSKTGQLGEGDYLVSDIDMDTLFVSLNSENHPWIGTEIPDWKVNITGFVGRKNNELYIYPEFSHDLDIIPKDTVLTVFAPENGLSFGNILFDEYSEPKSYELQAENLSENLRISTSDNFEISLLEHTNYAADLELPINEKGDIPKLTIYVRFSPIANQGGEIKGDVLHLSGGKKYQIDLVGMEEIITSKSQSIGREILIYPNPVSTYLNIELVENGVFEYQILNINGALIQSGRLDGSETLNLKDVDSGVYLLKLFNAVETHNFRFFKD